MTKTERTGRKPNLAKLRRMYLMAVKGWTYQQIADDYGVTRQAVGNSIRRYTELMNKPCPWCGMQIQEDHNGKR